MLSEALRQRKIPENPATGIRLPNGHSERAVFTMAAHAQLLAIESELPEPWQLAIWLQRGCGCRAGEALAVRADSVRGAELRLEEQVLGTGNLGPLKARKPGEYRDVPLPGYLARKIDDHVKTYGIAKDGYLFPMFASGSVRQRAYRDAFGRGVKAAELPESFTSHDLRHTFASVALTQGIPLL